MQGIAVPMVKIRGIFLNNTHSNPDGVLINPGSLLKRFMG
jgi:hypothetical protein